MNNVSDAQLQQNSSRDQQSGDVNNQSTPIQSRKSIVQDIDPYSPIFSQCTQEENDNVDVMWDWYSPHSKPRVRKHKRADIHQSPKLPIKRQPSNNQINGFNKLKEELETLRDEIIEGTGTGVSEVPNSKQTETKCNTNIKDLEDVFNDSMEEELLVCSQEAEHMSINGKPVLKDQSSKYLDKTPPSQKRGVEIVSCSKASIVQVMKENNNEVNKTIINCVGNNNNIESNAPSKCVDDNLNKIADDSFDFILGTLKDEDLNKPLTTTDEKARKPSPNPIQNKKQFDDNISKCTAQEIEHKRKEAHSKLQEKKMTDNTSKCTAQEIEQKRKEALSKLQEKKKQATCEDNAPKCTAQEIEQKRKEALSKLQVKKTQVAYESESPIKCSPEEIEQKRLQAIAKLEAKKKQDVIERNRQQAIKRLEENKRKRALQTQTSLPRKIHNPNI